MKHLENISPISQVHKRKNFNGAYVPYTYKNVPIPGGGYVTGFAYHPYYQDILYARTDIGGVYRYDFLHKSWRSLMDHVTNKDLSESYPLAIALDPKDKDSLYIACGDNKKGLLCISNNRGEDFIYRDIPCPIHGNAPGRGTGDRLIVDPNNSSILYFASQRAGLLRSMDQGITWENLIVGPVGGNNELEITSIWIDSRSNHNNKSQVIVVGTSGAQNADNSLERGHTLYLSKDGGTSFTPLICPIHHPSKSQNIKGLVPQRMAFDGRYLYISFSGSGPRNFSGFSNYSCDSGTSFDGRLARYQIEKTGELTEYEEITPTIQGDLPEYYGISGVAIHSDQPGLLLCSTICKKDSDIIFLSKDYGHNWRELLRGLDVGQINFTVPYMKPEYNGDSSIIHWLSDIKINPFNCNQAVFNTGTGIFMTDNLLEDDCTWYPCCDGLEETVHLNVYSPPSGEVQLIDILGDLGGFAFKDLNKPAENTFADPNKNRYITCINADYSDFNPSYVVATPRGNWTGKTIGGVILSKDQCDSFTLLSHPFGITPYINQLLKTIEEPNKNSGWVALSSDTTSIVWSIADDHFLPITAVVYTKDEGKTWAQSVIYDTSYTPITSNEIGFKVMADRVNPNIFYGFSTDSRVFVSKDSGAHFKEYPIDSFFPKLDLSSIDGRNHTEIRVEAGKEGVIWLSLLNHGLWKLVFNLENDTFYATPITRKGDVVYCQGMGKGKTDQRKTLYICGIINGTYGIFRSDNEGSTFTKINDSKQMYGDVRTITGDPRVYGRVYIGTGSRGVLYGEPQ